MRFKNRKRKYPTNKCTRLYNIKQNQYIMKNLIKVILMFSIFLCITCAPKINYLGNSYTPTQNVDLFFDEHDINREYKVMGVMKNEAGELEMDDVEEVKKSMINKAKSVGADAILFVNFYSERQGHDHGQDIFNDIKKIYEAKLIKYL